MGHCWAWAFAEPKQSSWYQWHEVQWWGGLVDIVTWGWGVLACPWLFLAVLFRNWEGEREGGREVDEWERKWKRECCKTTCTYWRLNKKWRGKQQRLSRSFIVWEVKGWKRWRIGTNTVFFCIHSAAFSGKLLAPWVYEPCSPESEPSLA